MTHTSLVNCRWPIMAAPMNRVSDVTLAIAVAQAGGLASLSLFNYYNDKLDYNKFKADLELFQTTIGHCDLLVSMGPREFFDEEILSILMSHKVAVVELLEHIAEDIMHTLQLRINRLRSNGVKVLMKVFTPRVLLDVDGIILKGPEGAGRANLEKGTLSELFAKTKRKYPTHFIIVSGGIGNAAQVKEYLALGADMIAVGTIFAAAVESPVSLESKQAMIAASSQMLSRLPGYNQQGLVFSTVEQDDANHTQSLLAGIASPTAGHIFAGRGIDFITEVVSVATVMNNLTQDL